MLSSKDSIFDRARGRIVSSIEDLIGVIKGYAPAN